MDNRSRYYHEQLTAEYTSTPNNGISKTPAEEQSAYLLYNILVPSFGVIIMASNLAVVISCCRILKKGLEPKSTYLLLCNVALAGVLTGIAVVFGQVLPVNLRSQQTCACQIGLILSSVIVSIYCFGLVSLDRFLYILYGVQYQRRVQLIQVQALAVIVWIFGNIVGYLPLMGWSGDSSNGELCWFIIVAPKKLIFITVLISIFPIILTIFLYSIILYRSVKDFNELQVKVNEKQPFQESNLKKLRAFKGQTIHPHKPIHQQRSLLSKIFKKRISTSINMSKLWKAIKLVVFSMSCFIITWFPYMIVSLYYVNVCNANSSKRCKSLSLVLASPLAVLGVVNTLLNPIIYAWWHKGFNRFVKRRISTFRLRSSSQDKRIGLNNTNSNATMNTILESSNEYIDNV